MANIPLMTEEPPRSAATRGRNLLLMSLFVPLWLTVGRGLLGSFGWMTFMMIMFVIPLLLPPALTLLFTTRADVKKSGHLTRSEATSLWLFNAVYILFGFFLVDGGDTEDSMGSVFSKLLGSDWIDISSYIAFGLLVLGMFLGLLVLKDAIVGRRRMAQDQKE